MDEKHSDKKQQSPVLFMGNEYFKVLVAMMKADILSGVNKDIESQVSILTDFFTYTQAQMAPDVREKCKKEIEWMRQTLLNLEIISEKKNVNTTMLIYQLKIKIFEVKNEIFTTLKNMMLKTGSDDIFDMDSLSEEMD
jgi:hypothetical protein